MRFVGVALLALLLVSCERAPEQARVAPTPQEAVFHGKGFDQAKFDKIIKRFPTPPNYDDKTSCETGGGRWAQSYSYGTLIIDKPNELSREPLGEMCWLDLVVLADAGKVCSGPDDCMGNCIAERDVSGKAKAVCQPNEAEPNCTAIYDGHDWIVTECWVP